VEVPKAGHLLLMAVRENRLVLPAWFRSPEQLGAHLVSLPFSIRFVVKWLPTFLQWWHARLHGFPMFTCSVSGAESRANPSPHEEIGLVDIVNGPTELAP
jgi:hypothetical protein